MMTMICCTPCGRARAWSTGSRGLSLALGTGSQWDLPVSPSMCPLQSSRNLVLPSPLFILSSESPAGSRQSCLAEDTPVTVRSPGRHHITVGFLIDSKLFVSFLCTCFSFQVMGSSDA
jgi:hypothetical protein